MLLNPVVKQTRPAPPRPDRPARPAQSIIRSYRQASALAVAKVKELSISLEGKSEAEKRSLLTKCASTSLNSKLVRGGRVVSCVWVCWACWAGCCCGRPVVCCGGAGALTTPTNTDDQHSTTNTHVQRQVSGEKEFFSEMVVTAVSRLDPSTLDLKMIGMKKVGAAAGGFAGSFWTQGGECLRASRRPWRGAGSLLQKQLSQRPPLPPHPSPLTNYPSTPPHKRSSAAASATRSWSTASPSRRPSPTPALSSSPSRSRVSRGIFAVMFLEPSWLAGCRRFGVFADGHILGETVQTLNRPANRPSNRPQPPLHQQPPSPPDPKILLLNIELELKSEKENAEIRLEDPAQYQVGGGMGVG